MKQPHHYCEYYFLYTNVCDPVVKNNRLCNIRVSLNEIDLTWLRVCCKYILTL